MISICHMQRFSLKRVIYREIPLVVLRGGTYGQFVISPQVYFLDKYYFTNAAWLMSNSLPSNLKNIKWY